MAKQREGNRMQERHGLVIPPEGGFAWPIADPSDPDGLFGEVIDVIVTDNESDDEIEERKAHALLMKAIGNPTAARFMLLEIAEALDPTSGRAHLPRAYQAFLAETLSRIAFGENPSEALSIKGKQGQGRRPLKNDERNTAIHREIERLRAGGSTVESAVDQVAAAYHLSHDRVHKIYHEWDKIHESNNKTKEYHDVWVQGALQTLRLKLTKKKFYEERPHFIQPEP